jgi:hypothetical protein
MRIDPMDGGIDLAGSPALDERGLSPDLGARLIRLARLAAAEHMVQAARQLRDEKAPPTHPPTHPASTPMIFQREAVR